MISPLPASSAFLAIAAVMLMSSAATLLGGWLYRADSFTKRADSFTKRASTDELLISFIIGLNVLAWIGVILGQLGLLGGLNPLGLLLSLIALGYWQAGRLRQVMLDAVRELLSQSLHAQRLWLNSVIPMIAVLTLGPALAYPDGWDELVYHATLPQRWATDGCPVVYADLPYSAFPSLAEILFWMVAAIDQVLVPRLLMWLCWCATLLLLARILQSIVTYAQAITLVLAYALCTTLLLVVNNCYVESLLAMNFVAALYLMLQLHESADCAQPRNWALPLGILAGGAAAVKLTGACVLAVVLVCFISHAYRYRSHTRQILIATAIFGLTAMTIAIPFYLRPWLATGNPFYPYLAQWFSHDLAIEEMSRYHHAIGSSFGISSWTTFLAAPFLLAFDNLLYDGAFGGQAILLIGLAVWELICALRRRQFTDSPTLWLSLSTVGLYTFWFATAQQSRFAILAWITLILLAAYGLKRSSKLVRQWMPSGLILLTTVSFPWQFSGYYFSTWTSALGLFSPVAHVAEGTGPGYLELLEPLGQLPPDAQLMLLFEERGFYLPVRQVIGTPFFQADKLTPPESFAKPEQVMRQLTNCQITHVLMAKSLAGPDKSAAYIERLGPLLAAIEMCAQSGQLIRQWESEYYILWSVEPENP
jgi:hypothetical protein